MKHTFLGILITSLFLISEAQDSNFRILEKLPYYPESASAEDPYLRERCRLYLYYPSEDKDFPTVAWVMQHIGEYGDDPDLVFVSGHSAGGYLTSMVGLDRRWLEKHDLDANRIAGFIPLSGHSITHFTVRAERGIEGTRVVVDDLAPLFHVRKDAPLLLLITGDREMEMLGRYEENAYLMRMMKVVGHPDTRLYEMDGYGHNMLVAAYPLLIHEVNRITASKKNTRP